MKHLSALALVTCLFLSVAMGAAPTPSFPEPAAKILKNGVTNESDLKAFLLAAPAWTWIRNGVPETSVKFEANGVATHTNWVGKWTATSSRKVVIHVPKAGLHTLTFSDDLTTFKGIWNSNVPFEGRFFR
ncbi:MAG TPA: hypothetical protein VGM54_01370 [Chthoniobacter sp.]|jgi:hypothetical protein